MILPGPANPPAPFSTIHVGYQSRRRLLDRFAKLVVQSGGLLVILSILAIFVFLVREVAPLFIAPTAKQIGAYPTERPSATLPQPSVVGVDEHLEITYRFTTDGIAFIDLLTGKSLQIAVPEAFKQATMSAVSRSHGKSDHVAAGTVDGKVITASIDFASDYASGNRIIVASINPEAAFQADPTQHEILRLAYQKTDVGTAAAVFTDAGRLWYTATRSTPRPDGNVSMSADSIDLTPHIAGTVTALVLDSRGETLSAGTADGYLYHFDVREITRPVLLGSYAVAPRGTAVTALEYLIGDRSLVIGTGAGDVSVWMPVRLANESNTTRLQTIHRFAPHSAAVTAISPSQRDKGFITGDANGNVSVHYATSEQTVLRLSGHGAPVQALLFGPKANGAVVLDREGQLRSYAINNPHPEITLASLFLPVWYEGYSQPEHVWQSSSGSDDFEPKFGLTPLIFGTLKGTLYALLLAVPLAVLGAIYTSMFMHPDLRARIKPVIEIMAALPTVVLGFLAGLWMAPLLERIFPAVVGMVFVVPLSVVLASLAWQLVPSVIRNRLRPGAEFLLLIPVIAGAVALCVSQNQGLEALLFGGHYKEWLASHLGVRYDQRNALVVGLAMGFAIIPDHLQHLGGGALKRPEESHRRFSGVGRHPLADAGTACLHLGKPRYLLGGHDRVWPGGRRDHDRTDGNRQHPDHGLEPLQRLPDPVCEHCGRNSRGASRRHVVPDPLHGGVTPLRHHVCP